MRPGDKVVVRKNNLWKLAKIVKADEAPRSFWIQDEDNRAIRRNTIHLRKSINTPQNVANCANNIFNDCQ